MKLQKNTFNAGLDIGSTTCKLVVTGKDSEIIYRSYQRHNTKIDETVAIQLKEVVELLGDINICLLVTGSAGIGISERFDIPFIQEIIASTDYIKKEHPEVKTLIDLGGEDSKMIFFNGQKTPDIRMNGSCAGGTGAFIDQMATLMNVPIQELNDYSKRSKNIYPIASRCGVFAKTDLQNLISRKILREDIVASVFRAVAAQAMNTLARAFDVKPAVLFSGGPFSFMPELKNTFIAELGMKPEDAVEMKYPELLPALGAAISENSDRKTVSLNDLILKIESGSQQVMSEKHRLNPLFDSDEHRKKWIAERINIPIVKTKLEEYRGLNTYLGIDSGSTTTKIVLIGENKEVLFDHYSANKGNPIKTVCDGLELLEEKISTNAPGITIKGTSVTGYGEDLIKAALGFDFGIVETIAHYAASKHFVEDVSFILDIGGQDMKAIFITDGIINRIELNESCSSGCGSFIETFGNSLGLPVGDFAEEACKSDAPCDLGTRCTVFMNSKVKQSLRENAGVGDISAGLAISVIKNALFKVLKLKDFTELGPKIVIQGGTFKNPSVHRALEILSGKSVFCSDIPELMGAFGAALYACDMHEKGVIDQSSFIGFDKMKNVESIEGKQLLCKGCENNCLVTRFTFSQGRNYYAGNKCEQVFSNKGESQEQGINFFELKRKKLFEENPVKLKKPVHRIGIPRVLNFFDNYIYWKSLFAECNIEIVLSSPSSLKVYNKGQGTVMSDNICFPAKLVHGHIVELIESKVDRIFYPMIVYESEEFKGASGTFNCPIVSGYPDVVRSAIDPAKKYNIPFDSPALNFRDPKLLKKGLWKYIKELGISRSVFQKAFEKAGRDLVTYRAELKDEAEAIIQRSIKENRMLFVLAGRPYHADKLINHKAPEILAELGVDIIPEDVLPTNHDSGLEKLHVITQWAYPNRIYNAAQWVASKPENIQFVQLNSFGCGPDAIVIDEAVEILKESGKFHTLLRVDEITSTGSLRLRIRSMIESLKLREKNNFKDGFERITTKKFEEVDKQRTIIAPIFSDIYSTFFPTLFAISGYKLINLPLPDKHSVDYGLKFSNNEICYPATIVIGDIIKALKSGEYDRNTIAVGITQTGGQCRASSYLSLIKKGMVAAGFEDVPVVSVGTGGVTINDQPGFNIDWSQILVISFCAALFADSLSKMYYSTAVREVKKGTAKKLLVSYLELAQPIVFNKDKDKLFELLGEAVDAFNAVETKNIDPPKIGIVGEIYVKYNDFGNHNAVEWLLSQGIEVVVPPLIDFFTQELVNFHINRKHNISKSNMYTNMYIYFIEYLSNKYVRKANRILSDFKYNQAFHKIRQISAKAENVLSLVNQYGEGWLIPAEISAFAEEDVHNVVSLQPFGCIANQVISKGIEKRLKDLYPDLNMLYLDLDDGASEVNLINRLHFMVKNVKEQVLKATLNK